MYYLFYLKNVLNDALDNIFGHAEHFSPLQGQLPAAVRVHSLPALKKDNKITKNIKYTKKNNMKQEQIKYTKNGK
jgi:hypothetical protein